MKYLVCILIVCGFAFYCKPTSAQSISIRPSWDELVAESTIVAVGKVLGSAQVIRPDKLNLPSQTLPDGRILVPTPDPEEYLLGHVVRFHLEEVLGKDRKQKMKKGDVLDIFLTGWFPRHGDPIFVMEREHLIFLTPTRVNADETAFVGAVVEDPDGSGKTEPFDPRSCFIVVGGNHGVVALTAKNRRVIAQVKAALRRRK